MKNIELNQNIFLYCRKVAPVEHSFIIDGKLEGDNLNLQNICDIIYTYYLLGEIDQVNENSISTYQSLVASLSLYGRDIKEKTPINAHLTAYILGSILLLKKKSQKILPDLFYEHWKLDLLVNKSKFVPHFPRMWAHHTWRVSHWIGGAPSIIYNLNRLGLRGDFTQENLSKILDAIEIQIIDDDTGLMRAYNSKFIQGIFRLLYSIRHDPHVADYAGLVHFTWLQHAVGRNYKCRSLLYKQACEIVMSKEIFMEDAPYCLDFDIIQLLRTSNSDDKFAAEVLTRIEKYQIDLKVYLSNINEAEFTLHKVPGAVATLIEVIKILESHDRSLGELPDIIREVGWL